jgi:CRP-like cAMP-binding protein
MEQKILDKLTNCPLFAGMSPVEIEIALSGVKWSTVQYDAHDIYAPANMPYQHLDIVLSGTLICRMSSLSGKQVEVSRLRDGNIVAPAFVFAKNNNMPVGVETGTPVTVFRMRKPEFEQLLRDNWQLSMNFMRVLSNINAFLTKRMRVLSLYTVREKVAWLLMERAGEQGSNVIHLFRSRQEIADSFGIQKFSLLRVLSDFQKEGAIKINGREITILDRQKMK